MERKVQGLATRPCSTRFGDDLGHWKDYDATSDSFNLDSSRVTGCYRVDIVQKLANTPVGSCWTQRAVSRSTKNTFMSTLKKVLARLQVEGNSGTLVHSVAGLQDLIGQTVTLYQSAPEPKY